MYVSPSLRYHSSGSKASDGVSGGGVTRVFERRDRAPFHYMDKIAGFSFGRDGHFATCQESLNNYEGMMKANKVRDRGR